MATASCLALSSHLLINIYTWCSLGPTLVVSLTLPMHIRPSAFPAAALASGQPQAPSC